MAIGLYVYILIHLPYKLKTTFNSKEENKISQKKKVCTGHPAGNSRDKTMKLGFHTSEDLDIQTQPQTQLISTAPTKK